MQSTVINTRADLDAIAGTPAHAAFMQRLRGSMTQQQDTAVRPEGYGQPGYDGVVIAPVWEDVEDLTAITAFGFIKADFAGETAQGSHV
jgi:hypothetical protein